MSVLIKGIEMPPKGYSHSVVITENGAYCDGEKYEAVPVPPHGQLIDADILLEFVVDLYRRAQGDARKAYREVLDAICAEGAVIEGDAIEEEEGKA